MHDTYHDFLRSVAMFRNLDDHELDQVARHVTDLQLEAGRVVMTEGTLAHEMLIVVDGILEVTHDGEHVADIGPGEVAGEMALLARTHRSHTVSTKTDANVLHIDGREFTSLLEEVPEIAVKLLPIVAERVAESIEFAD